MIEDYSKVDYPKKARDARLAVLKMIHEAESSHIGSNFSCIDILTVLFEHMNMQKDEFICSKGWVAASVYYFLSEKGVIPKEDLSRYCREGEDVYIGLVEPQNKWGLRAAGGAVGYGLSFGVGFALSKKLKGEEGTVYVLMSDGEQQVGMVYESALVAAHHGLNNLVAIIDNNHFQATGRPSEVLNIEPLDKKWKSWGWDVWDINGHNLNQIRNTLSKAYVYSGLTDKKPAPQVIIANTIKGKGVSFMKDKLEWHYRNVDAEHYQKARSEIV